MKQWYSRWKSCSIFNIQFRRSFSYVTSTLYFICHRFPHVYVTLRPSTSTLSFAVSNQLVTRPRLYAFTVNTMPCAVFSMKVPTLHSKIPTSEQNTFPISLFTCLVNLNIAGTLPRHLSIFLIDSHFNSTFSHRLFLSSLTRSNEGIASVSSRPTWIHPQTHYRALFAHLTYSSLSLQKTYIR